MKKYLFFTLLIMQCFIAFSQSRLNTVVQGSVLNFKSSNLKLEFVNNPLDDTLTVVNIELNEKGQFYHELPIIRPMEAKLNGIDVYLAPGERVEFTLDATTNTMVKVFSTTDNNKYLIDFKLKFINEEKERVNRIINDDEIGYAKFEDSLYKEKEVYLFSYEKAKRLSYDFVRRQKAIYKYTAINNKYNYLNNYQFYTKKSKTLDSTYYLFLKQNVFDEDDLVNIQEVFKFVDNNYRFVLNSDKRAINSELDLIDKEFSIAESLYLGRVKNILLTKIFAEILYNYPYRYSSKYITMYMSNVKVDEYRYYIDKRILEASIASYGTEAYNFNLVNSSGKLVKLSDFRGKKVYLNFWASWCAPCLAEIENHNKIHEKFNSSDFITIMISVDTDTKAWKKTLNKFNKKIVQLNLNGMKNETAKNYKLRTIPKSLLIDKNGIIIQEELPQPSDAKILELLKSN